MYTKKQKINSLHGSNLNRTENLTNIDRESKLLIILMLLLPVPVTDKGNREQDFFIISVTKEKYFLKEK